MSRVRGDLPSTLETAGPLLLAKWSVVCGLVFYFNHLLGGKYECSEVSCFGRMRFFSLFAPRAHLEC